MTTEGAGEPEPLAAPSAEGPELRGYDELMKDLESPEPDTSGAAPVEDPRIGKLREAFESGKISREVYEANLRRLTKQP